MKENNRKLGHEVTVGSVKCYVFTLVCVIFVSTALTQCLVQVMAPLPSWSQYTIQFTLLISLILPIFYYVDIGQLKFVSDKVVPPVQTSVIDYDYLNTLIATSPIIIFSMQMVNHQLYPEWVSDNVENILGYSREETLLPDWWLKYLHPQDQERVLADTAKLFQGEPVASDYRFLHKNGTEIWIHDDQRLVYDAKGKITRVVNTWSDITSQKTALLEQVTRLRMFKIHEGLVGADGLSNQSLFSDLRQDCELNYEDGTTSPRPFDGFYDITNLTDRDEMEERIRNLAFYDPLTQLPNRRLLLERINQGIQASASSRRHGALLFLDLDRFKILNDTYGHNMGDQLLLEVTGRLQICVREGDTIARLGGDEFVLMFNGLDQYAAKAEIQAKKMAEKIRAVLAKPFYLSPQSQSRSKITYHSSASIGIVLFLGHGSNTEELMQFADLAMYEAKHAGRDAVCIFDPGMQTDVMARTNLEEDMHQALKEKQFLLHYQPQVDTKGYVTGCEALVRWQHPLRGLVSPATFIPLAEESGLILPLGLWVLETACTQLATWAGRQETEHLTLSVNVSAHQFRQNDFVTMVLDVLERTGANPNKLKLELTESMLVSDVEGIIIKMTELKSKGIGFSLDDFGTGYSSLTYLKRLPLDQLKIDQGFVRDILIDANDAAIAQMIVALAESMGIAVIAEGVETDEQLGFLSCQGCHAYQGYLFSHPLPLLEFDEFMRRGLYVAA